MSEALNQSNAQRESARAGEGRTEGPAFKHHTFGALIGPGGRIAMGWREPAEMDWGCLWDHTEDWPCEDHDIHKAAVTVRVPVFGPGEMLQTTAVLIEPVAPPREGVSEPDEESTHAQ